MGKRKKKAKKKAVPRRSKPPKPAPSAPPPEIELHADDSSPDAADAVKTALSQVAGGGPDGTGVPEPVDGVRTSADIARFFAEVEEYFLLREAQLNALHEEVIEREKRVTERERFAFGGGINLNELRVACVASAITCCIDKPTPAIVGRVMHELGYCGETPPTALPLKPITAFRHIHHKNSVFISPKIEKEMKKYKEPGKPRRRKGDGKTIPKSQRTSHAADELREEFSKRLAVLIRWHLALTVHRHDKYDHFLTGWGPAVFDAWPKWGDPTGGDAIFKHLLEPPPPPPGP